MKLSSYSDSVCYINVAECVRVFDGWLILSSYSI